MGDAIAALLEEAWKLRESEEWGRILELAQRARSLAERSGFTAGVARALAISAFAHYVRSDIPTAISECMDALRLAPGDAETEIRTRSTLALIHWSLGNYAEALDNIDRSLRSAQGAGLAPGFLLAVKGGILLSLGAPDEALDWHRRSLEAFDAGRDGVVEKARVLAGLGLVYLAQKRHDDALEALREALEIARGANHRVTIARALNDLGEAYEALGNDDEALRHHEAALAIRQQNDYRPAETTSLLALARIHGRRGDDRKAIELGERALSIATELELRPRIAQCHERLAATYERTGQLAEALRHVRAWERVKSELAVEEAALRYRAVALEAQIEAVQRQTELESLATLGSLVAAISHEINTPLGAMQSSADSAARAAEKLARGHDPKLAELLQANTSVLGEAAERIAQVVGRLKVFAGIDQAAYAGMSVVGAVEDTVALLRPEFDPRVAVVVEHDAEPFIYAYASEMHQVFLNLLRNATQAVEATGRVLIRVTADEEWIRIAFADSGPGIPAEVVPQLFSPSFRAGEKRVRASLSLFTCRAVVKKHGGEIDVESRPGAGATFTVRLPRSLERPDSGLGAGATASSLRGGEWGPGDPRAVS